MANNIFGESIPLLEGEIASTEDINVPFEEGRLGAYKSAQSGFSRVAQRAIAEKIVEDNVSNDAFESSGLSVEDITDHIQSKEVSVPEAYKLLPESMRKNLISRIETDSEFSGAKKAFEVDKKLKAAGIDAEELHGRISKQVAVDMEEDDRSSLAASIIGGIQGYIDDRYNLAGMFIGPSGTLKSGTKIGTQVAKAALANMLVEAALVSDLETPLSEKVTGVVGAGVGTGVFMGAGKALGFAKKGIMDIFNKSRLAKDVGSKIVEKAEKLPAKSPLKAMLKEEASFLSDIGGTFDDAMTIRVKTGKAISEGKSVGDVVTDLKIELPGGTTIRGRTRAELTENLREKLVLSRDFAASDIDDAIARIDTQEFIGHVDRFTVITEDAARKKIPFVRSSGRKVIIDSKKRHLVYETRELAEASMKKRKLDGAQVIAQKNGKFAIVKEVDEAIRLDGTAPFSTLAKAEKELPEYAARMGLDPEDLSISVVPSRSLDPNIKNDYIISHIGSAGTFPSPERTTNTILDDLVITKGKTVSEPPTLEFALGDQAKVTLQVEEILSKKAVTNADIAKNTDKYIDQLVSDDTIVFDIPDSTLDFKKFNGFLKQSRTALAEFKKSCL